MPASRDGSLIDLAGQLVFYRDNALDRSVVGSRTIKMTLSASIFALICGAGLLATIALVQNQQNGWAFVLACIAGTLVALGSLGVRRTVSQATYEKVTHAIEQMTRVLSVVVSSMSILLSLGAICLLSVRLGNSGWTATAILAFVFSVIATVMALSVADSSRALVRADKGDVRQGDAKFRMVALWVTLVVDVWVALQLAKRVENSLKIFGLVELVLIVAVPLLFAYATHRADVRRRLGMLASLLGETQAAAEGAVRSNASADVRAQLRAQLVRLQTLLHTDRAVKLAGFRIRGLVDPELVVLIDQIGLSLSGITVPPRSEINSPRVKWLQSELAISSTAANVAKLVEELRHRALLALNRY